MRTVVLNVGAEGGNNPKTSGTVVPMLRTLIIIAGT
jgi:hypothetical protein